MKKNSLNFPFMSNMQGIDWPAIGGPKAAAQLAMQFQLEQSQWLDPEDIKRQQMRQLNILYQYARRNVPFYRERFQGVTGKGHRELAPDQFQNLPLLTRYDIQKAGDLLKSCNSPPNHGKAIKVSTSGSTGKPVTVWQNDVTAFFWRTFTLREHFWHKRNFSGKLAAIRFFEGDNAKGPYGAELAGWGVSTDNVLKTGPAVILNIKTPVAQQAQWLIQNQPEYLITHPSNAYALAKHFMSSNDKLHSLLEIRTLGETLTRETQKACKEVFGVEITDMYTTREVGYIALQCPEHRSYHVQSENVLVEVLDENGVPCMPGEAGKVVVTSLHNYASPIIRYDIGDYAEIGEPCSCGRGLPVINRIMGRVRNILTLPTGQRNWPVFNYKELENVLSYKQIQFIQHTLTAIEVRLVVEGQVTPDLERRMTKIIRKALGFNFTITFSYLPEIPRSKGGKYEEFMSRINN